MGKLSFVFLTVALFVTISSIQAQQLLGHTKPAEIAPIPIHQQNSDPFKHDEAAKHDTTFQNNNERPQQSILPILKPSEGSLSQSQPQHTRESRDFQQTKDIPSFQHDDDKNSSPASSSSSSAFDVTFTTVEPNDQERQHVSVLCTYSTIHNCLKVKMRHV